MANSITIQGPSKQHSIRKLREELQSSTYVSPAEHLPCGRNQL